VFCCFVVVFLVVTCFLFPGTKGHSLEEIAIIFGGEEAVVDNDPKSELPYGGIDWMFPRFIHQEFYSKNNWRKNTGKSKIDPAYWRKVIKFNIPAKQLNLYIVQYVTPLAKCQYSHHFACTPLAYAFPLACTPPALCVV
jgi:hypothetical protein